MGTSNDDNILEELSQCSQSASAACIASQIGVQVGADVGMKKVSQFALNRILRQQMEKNTLKYSENVSKKMAEKYGAEWASRSAEKEVGEMAFQLQLEEEVGVSMGPIGLGIDFLMTAGMLMDLADAEGYNQAKSDAQIEAMMGSTLQKYHRAQQSSLTNLAASSKDPLQKACWQQQADRDTINTHPISGGMEVSKNLNLTKDSAINLNDPVVQRKIKHYMLDYLAYTSKGSDPEPPLLKDGSPDEANWKVRPTNSRGQPFASDYLKGNPKISNKYARTKSQLDFEDGYAKKMYQMGEKYKNENVKKIGLHMQQHPSMWISGLTVVIGLVLWGLLRLLLPEQLRVVNAFSSLTLAGALIYIKADQLDTAPPYIDYGIAAALGLVGGWNIFV